MSERLSARYVTFAEQEAKGHSPLYEELARGVAGDRKLLDLIDTLPRDRQQPNLVFAAYRMVCGTPGSFPEFRQKFVRRAADIVAVVMARRTQTNEPGRCAVLLPALALMHQPLALIEVGASAGLCLIPDHYAYEYDGQRLGRPTASPVFPCRTSGDAPIPTVMPKVVWRAGLDIAPMSLHDPDHVAWLEALIWPDQPERLERFRAALATARQQSIRIRTGDLRTDVEAMLREAPTGPTKIVYHTAVLGYLGSMAERKALGDLVWDYSAVWISNEAPHVLPQIAARAPRSGPPGAFLLSVNAAPVAWTDPHGAWIDWMWATP